MGIKFFDDIMYSEERKREYEKYEQQLREKGIPIPDYQMPKPEEILEPKIDPQLVVYWMIRDYTPEKTELSEGVLYFGEPWISRMFLLHLYHVGLKEAVKFAPKELWLKALEEWDGKQIEIE